MRGRSDTIRPAARPRGACRLLGAGLLGLAALLAAPASRADAAPAPGTGAEPAREMGSGAAPAGPDRPAPEIPGPPGGDPGPVPDVPLDRLFELPRGFELEAAERRGGAGASEWRQRFQEARDEVETSRATLRASKAELAELAEASDSWAVAPPVGAAPSNANDAPLSYALRQRIQREEAAVKRAERQLLDLEVEANLADVPEAWRQ